MDCHFRHTVVRHINLLATAAEDVAHLLLLGHQLHRLGGVVRDFLRLLTLVIVNVLLNRVVFGEHIEDFSLGRALLYAVSVTLLLHVHDLVAFDIEHVLTSLQGRL